MQVAYSSTCPCSAALARQLIQENFAGAVPRWRSRSTAPTVLRLARQRAGHQRHAAQPAQHAPKCSAKLAPSFQNLPFIEIIDRVEAALKTPVQTAVKREDEQAFARLNGQNLMFCEDAARRMQAALDEDERISDFWVRASHFESLHPHNAVAVATKGVAGGYSSVP